MRYSSEHKAETRKRILKTAGETFRERGRDEATIPGIMEDAGLTVGGFYRHFESKDDLFREAIAATVQHTARRFDALPDDLSPEAFLEAMTSTYLSKAHRDNVRAGCALPALAADIARSGDATKTAFGGALDGMVDRIARRLEPDDPQSARDRAWAFLALNVGALVLARGVRDPEQSEAILAAARSKASDFSA